MDSFTITLLGACGVSLTGAIAILWKSLEKQRDDNTAKDQKITEQFYSSKSQNENTQALLVVMKDEIKSMREAFTSLQDKILRKRS